MSSCVLDASAILAFFKGEPGADRVRVALAEGVVVGAVNLAEAVTKLSESGEPETAIRGLVYGLDPEIVPFDEDLAYATGLLRPLTRHLGLSLGDRACLALAQRLGLPALTADRAWAALQIGVVIEVVR